MPSLEHKDKIAISVKRARDLMGVAAKATLSQRQRASLKAAEVKEPVWISEIELLNPSEDDLRQTLLKAIQDSSDNDGNGIIDLPRPLLPVGAEWIGRRRRLEQSDDDDDGGLEASSMTEEEKYSRLCSETENETVILYCHGGGNFLYSAASCRSTTAKLARLTKGRCLSVNYRLAPQNPFPAALLDLLTAYLCLLSPPAGSYHKPVAPSSIVLAGDSAGASLCLALIQVILRVRDQQATLTPTIQFHGRRTAIPLPAGVTALSPAGDITSALPSWKENADFDIFRDLSPMAQPDFPPDDIWPSNPPRSDPYCETSYLSHPLVALSTVKTWKGAPPMWIACGQERLADTAKIVARTAAMQGVAVIWEQYLRMPHTWAQIFPNWPQSARCFQQWADACLRFSGQAGGTPISSGTVVEDDGVTARNVTLEEITPLTPMDAKMFIEERCKELKPYDPEKKAKSVL